MILSDLQQYLAQRGSATLGDISNHFDANPDAIRGMLDLWIRKGRVVKQLVSADCGGSCTKCSPEQTEIYQWIGTGFNTISFEAKQECYDK